MNIRHSNIVDLALLVARDKKDPTPITASRQLILRNYVRHQ